MADPLYLEAALPTSPCQDTSHVEHRALLHHKVLLAVHQPEMLNDAKDGRSVAGKHCKSVLPSACTPNTMFAAVLMPRSSK